MIKKIISNGDAGVGLAALLVARELKIETGGWIPKGYITSAGVRPDLWEYGLKPYNSYKSHVAVYQNISESDGTLVLSYNTQDAVLIDTIKSLKKPYFTVNLGFAGLLKEVVDWIKHYNIERLNVVGSNEILATGITGDSAEYLTRLMEQFK